ncbi:MAG: Rrf2 family transcriptional regulator [Bacillota bacterium]
MKLSTKGRYGLRAIVDMAVFSNGELVSINSIAERQGISANYLEQVFSSMRKAGLVKSVKGSQGGYSLTKSISELTIGEIIRALEGEISIVSEVTDGEHEGSIQKVIKNSVWNKIDVQLNEIFDSITIKNLVEDYDKMNEKDNLMFYI